MGSKLYGIGVGPGDPELLTLKALKTLEAVDVIAYIVTKNENSMAKDIVEGLVDFSTKEELLLESKMTKDKALRDEVHKRNAERIVEVLKKGKSVAFLTIGDITIYSTFRYISEFIEKNGFEVEWINGISSFSAAAARAKMSLTEIDESLHIYPASFPIECEGHSGTQVFMKSASHYEALREKLLKNKKRSYLVCENVTGKDESILPLEEKTSSSYFTLIISKETL
ncbi:precorrin-2 C(20)-methyltransferase [Guggenheimella bovis]